MASPRVERTQQDVRTGAGCSPGGAGMLPQALANTIRPFADSSLGKLFAPQLHHGDTGGEKKCSAGFQPAGGLVDTKRVIQAQMPARRRRYHFFSRPRSTRSL